MQLAQLMAQMESGSEGEGEDEDEGKDLDEDDEDVDEVLAACTEGTGIELD
jgi:hypothetical protein